MISVSLASDKDEQIWSQYLEAQDIQHHAFAWPWRQIISEVFSHDAYYLIARREENICGILPLFHMKSMLFGAALCSIPYLNAGGALADDEEVFKALLEKARELASSLEVDYMELRHLAKSPMAEFLELQERTHKVSMILDLKPDPEELFSAFPAKLRSQIRRPSKSGVYAEVSDEQQSELNFVNEFYTVFAENMRDLGTPVYPKSLFQAVSSHFGKQARFICAWHEDKAIAAGITISQGKSVEIPWASSLRKYNRMSPNMLLYWQAIKTACLDGNSSFDFGRSSPDAGTYRFKQQWGSVPRPLFWYYDLHKGKVPEVNPNSPKYSGLVACWRRLPLPVANLIGPWLTKSLP